MKRILLINPSGTEQSGYSNPPLGLLYLGGTLLKGGFEVRVIDGCVAGDGALEKSLAEFRPHIAGITCLTPARKRALDVARRAKGFDKNILTVLGGVHPTIMYDQILGTYDFVDVAVLGEGERAFLEIAQGLPLSGITGIAYRGKDGIVKTPPRVYEKDLDNIPFPAWHLLDLKKYPARGLGIVNGIDLAREPRVSVVFSRGCTGHCDFCSTWRIWRGWRHRSPTNMADEIEILYRDFGMRHFCFADDSLTVDKNSILGLCREIVSRKLRIAFHATTRTDLVDEELLRAMKEAGCYNIAFGIETSSPELLKRIGKNNTISASERAISLCHKIGIRSTALIIAGGVGETWETINETAAFLRRIRPDEVGSVGGLWVLPGTRLYKDCVAKGLIDDDFWLGDDPYLLYTVEHSPEALYKMRDRVSNYDTLFSRVAARVRRILKWNV
ncbi:MAG: hypothetical protein COT17_02710 [Elusimicrobia bacterium CG08_land_8_20_14_0_20_51_18]|nr:MAG: hypothetical protein COT17_02710 [Elusimicrobia bacterium CG08_land_8_20_14_0_20_51_18]